MVNKKITEKQIKILKLLDKKGLLTTTDLSYFLGIARITIQDNIFINKPNLRKFIDKCPLRKKKKGRPFIMLRINQNGRKLLKDIEK